MAQFRQNLPQFRQNLPRKHKLGVHFDKVGLQSQI
jgi:hypothetical protein